MTIERLINSALWIAISLAILWVFWTGNIIHAQPDRQSLIAAIWQHVGFAMVWTLPILLYVLFRKIRHDDHPTKGVYSIVDNVFWLSLGLLFMTGFMTVWSRGSDVKVFDWFVVPTPVERMQSLYELLEASHGLLSKAFIVIAVLWAGSHLHKAYSEFWSQQK